MRRLPNILWAVCLLPCCSLWGDLKGSGNITFDANADGRAEAFLNTTGLGIGTTSPSTNLHILGNAYVSGNVGLGTTTPSHSLHVSGTLGFTGQSVSANTTLSGNTMIFADAAAAGGNITLTLPTAANSTGRMYYIKKVSSGNTVLVRGGGTIDGQVEVKLTTTGNGYPHLSVACDGTSWYILSQSSENSGTTLPSSSNVVVWLDASDSGTLYTGSSSNVYQWNDKSGNGNNAVTDSGNTEPTKITESGNNLPSATVVKFDGSHALKISATSSTNLQYLSLFIVANVKDGSGSYGLMGDSQSNDAEGNWNFYVNFNSLKSRVKAFSLQNAANDPDFGAGTYRYLTQRVKTGGVTDQYVNGTLDKNETGTGGPMDPSDAGFTRKLTVGWVWVEGASNSGKCNIAEIILYNYALTDTDRASVESYLKSKWGL